MKYFKKFLLVGLLFVCNISGQAQQITDYIAGYAFPTTTLPRQGIDINYALAQNGSKFESDGKDIFYIINNVGNAKYESFTQEINIIEPTFRDTFNSELVFLKYNINSKKFTAKTFGSNYMNSIFRVQMDEQKKSICVVISTCGDTVRLNPDDKNELIVYPERLQRYWLLTFDLQGHLLSKCLLAESSYSLAIPLINFHLGYLYLAKFDFNGNIILGFHPTKEVLKILPGKFHDSIKFTTLGMYFISYNQQSSKIEWLRRLNNGAPYYLNHSIPSEKFIMAINMCKKPNSMMDSIILITDEFGKSKLYLTSWTEGLSPGDVLTFVFKVDPSGTFDIFMKIKSKDNDKKGQATQVTSLILNQNDVLAIITSADSIHINDKSFLGRPDKFDIPGTGQLARRYSLLKIKFNTVNRETTQLLNFKDSIVPRKLIKAKTGFYILFTFSNTSNSYHILSTDTSINFKDDIFYNFPLQQGNDHTICRYDSIYKLNWMHKSSTINSISDYGNPIIIDYQPTYYFDINFKPGILGSISPKPQLVMAGIYNCTPIAYFETIQNGDLLNFINLSEYNCIYKWIFGDGDTSNLKSPSHVFKPSTIEYKISLVVTNTCGTDTFVRYFNPTIGVNKYKVTPLLKIYPNPVTDHTLFINKRLNEELTSVQLYNTFGQLMEDFKIEKVVSDHYKLELKTNLAHGIYYIKAISNDNSSFIAKLIIQ